MCASSADDYRPVSDPQREPVDRKRDLALSDLPEGARSYAVGFGALANTFAMSYGGPVYLVGSALRKNDPPDFDVRVVAPDADLERLYGQDNERRREQGGWSRWHWLRAYDRLKQSRRLSRALGVNVDFQVQSQADDDRHEEYPRYRLDFTPDGFFEAGLTDP